MKLRFFLCIALQVYAISAKSSVEFTGRPLKSITMEGIKLEVVELVRGLDVPWSLTFLSAKELLVTERKGSVKFLHLDRKVAQDISGVPPVFHRNQGGLLDLTLHPRFSDNKLIYMSMSVAEPRGQSTTQVVRARLEQNRFTQLKVIFKALPAQSDTKHYGSRLVFDKDGFLFVTVGDRGERKLAQDLSTHMGKLLRLTEDGKAPPDNPFVGRKNAKPEVWSYGHRNAQGLFLHPQTGEIWLHEHGPRGGDEINLVQRGANYGWPIVTYGREYYGPKISEETEKPGIVSPIHHYTPSIAPSGFAFWRGSFFLGSLVLTHLNRVLIQDKRVVKEERLLADLGQRFRSVTAGPDGHLYVGLDSGQILCIKAVE